MTTATHFADQLLALLEPELGAAGFEVVDLECVSIGSASATVRLRLDRTSGAGARIDLQAVTDATHLVNQVLDRVDPIAEQYTLEVSSPGLERPLRLPSHYRRFVGTEVSVKTRAGTDGERRVQGRLDSADDRADGAIVVGGKTIAYDDIERARTLFSWGPAPRPKGPAAKKDRVKTSSEEADAGVASRHYGDQSKGTTSPRERGGPTDEAQPRSH